MKKTKPSLWIINDYAGSPFHGMEFRHYYLGVNWTNDYNVTIVSGSYSHLYKNQPTQKSEKINGLNYRWLKVLKYKNSNSNKRALNWIIYSFKLLLLPFSLKAPKVILVSTLTPFPMPFAWLIAKLYKAKLIFEVKDIWPLTLIELGGFKNHNPMIIAMKSFELFSLKHADHIVSNLPNYKSYLKNMTISTPYSWISNGCVIEYESNTSLSFEKIKALIPKNKFVFGYTGGINLSNGMTYFCEAAKILKDDTNFFFIIIGKGGERAELKNNYGQLKNLLFIDPIPKNEIPTVLNLFNLCYLGPLDKKIYEYGIAANKIFDYMLSGKPIVFGTNSKNNTIELAKCGKTILPENSNEIIKALKEFKAMSKEELKQIGENGKNYATKNFNYKYLSNEYLKILAN